VKVCAGSAIAVIAHSTKTAYARLAQFSVPNALTMSFIDVLPFLHALPVWIPRLGINHGFPFWHPDCNEHTPSCLFCSELFFLFWSFSAYRTRAHAVFLLLACCMQEEVGSHDLVIDPVFTYLTYLGGSGPDQIGGSQVVNQTGSPAQALAIDSAGDVYVTGFTMSADFPVVNPYQPTSKTNTWTALVSALNPSGTALLYSTYLGGSVYTEGNSVVWDTHDNA
jgi:hypothetical protein